MRRQSPIHRINKPAAHRGIPRRPLRVNAAAEPLAERFEPVPVVGLADFGGAMRSLALSMGLPTSLRSAATCAAVTGLAWLPKLLRM